MDNVGAPIFPGKLRSLNRTVREGFIAELEKTASVLASSEEGLAQSLIGDALGAVGVIRTAEGLTNDRAAVLIHSATKTIKDNPGKQFMTAALSIDGTLVALLFNIDTGESKFLMSKMNVPQDNIAGEIFAEVFVKKKLEKLAEENGAAICWNVASYFCDMWK